MQSVCFRIASPVLIASLARSTSSVIGQRRSLQKHGEFLNWQVMLCYGWTIHLFGYVTHDRNAAKTSLTKDRYRGVCCMHNRSALFWLIESERGVKIIIIIHYSTDMLPSMGEATYHVSQQSLWAVLSLAWLLYINSHSLNIVNHLCALYL